MVDPLDVKFAALTAEFEKLTEAAGDQKAKKGVINTTKMFKAIKESGSVVADVLTAFQNAGSATDVFKSVVSDYAGYLSDSFWGEILTSIDFGSITTVISEKMAPAMSDLGEAVGEIFEGPVGDIITGGISFVADGLSAFAAVITGNTAALEDIFGNIPWLVEIKEDIVNARSEFKAQGIIAGQTLAGGGSFQDVWDALTKPITDSPVTGMDFSNLDIDALNQMLGINPDTQDEILNQSILQNDRIMRMINILEDQTR